MLAVLDTQAGEHVGGVEAGVVAKLPRDDFERARECLDHGLLLEVAVRVAVQVLANFHLGGATTSDYAFVLHAALDDHYGVVKGALDLADELLGAATENEGACSCLGAAPQEVVPFGADLDLVEGAACAEVMRGDIAAGGLDGGAGGTADTVEVGGGNTASAEDVAVGKVSGFR